MDLGTTNSAIAVLKGTDCEVIRNNEGSESTPSVVYGDKHGGLIVGRRAKERLDVDPKNTFSEFKLQMGSDAVFRFERNGVSMKPEELSAEVLKSLKADVRQRLGEEIEAAVITVPAAFDLPQCRATDEAANLAGFSTSPLLLEPVAAALAYGFQSESEKVYWLVYDFGGGTFDAAIIQVRDGVIKVVNHGGDNHLGGKLIDWAIVEQLLIPDLIAKHKLTDFRRGNPQWFGALAKLKQAAEQAKIRTSRDDTAEILIDYLCADDTGSQIEFDYELRRSDVERLAEPFIKRSLNICREALLDQKLDSSKIEKILLVGGPTLMPYFRERLEDPKRGLGIPLEFGIDPLTVVARGAAIFAGTQRLDQPQMRTRESGAYTIDLEYKPVGIDREPLVGGRIRTDDGQSFAGWTIEFVNAEAQPPWRSGKIALAANGAFMATLWADKGIQNIFQIELADQIGTKHTTYPDQIPFTIGIAVTGQSLIHSVGVSMADNKVDWFFEKGTPLPTPRIRREHRTAYAVRRDQQGDSIRIPIVEGNNQKAELNHRIGSIEIPSAKLRRDVPAGSEVEITIEIDESRLVKASAYIPILDESFEWGQKLVTDAPDISHMNSEIPRIRKRLEVVRTNIQDLGDPEVESILDELEQTSVANVERKLETARTDRAVADEFENDLRRFKAELEELEDKIAQPVAIAEAQQMIEWTESAANILGTPEQKKRFGFLRQELIAALDSRNADMDVLRRRTEEMNNLRLIMVQSQIEWWIRFFQYAEENRNLIPDRGVADRLLRQGHRAISANNLDELKSACIQLGRLLPGEEEDQFRRFEGATVKRY
jgi:molecular chaperone DnaK